MTECERRLAWIAAVFLIASIATRVGLAIFSGETYTVVQWARFLSVGLIYDLTVLGGILLPWAIYEAIRPLFPKGERGLRIERVWALLWAGLYLSFFLCLAAAEFAFWGEFASRFDFIAVDYLIYTHEVIGNIEESYPVTLWLIGIFTVSVLLCWATWPRRQYGFRSWPVRWARVAIVAAIAVASPMLLSQKFAESAPNNHVGQLSNNGIFSFVHAFRNNELDYAKYYPQLPEAELKPLIRTLVRQPNTEFINDDTIDRQVRPHNPKRKVNVILISVESLSAAFLGKFGNKQGLSPEFDRLADQSLLFTKLYATGTRTVRGLEALSISTPPTPGQSIVRRPNNQGLENLGEELRDNGWHPYWIYGGYGFFDNMNAYFGANHYTVIDRSDVADNGVEIHHENIWGIADEDLYTLAMKTFDKSHAKGELFFAHIMTTSNHRPYTFPEGRVDMPQKKRESAVKYTDWAIGDFIRRARSHPWFKNTLFIITADHTSKAAGRTDLPPSRYHIPMIWYAPGLIEPGVMPRLMSQADVVPTLLGWLGIDYVSRFMGYDIFVQPPERDRAFISTYQKLGYLKGDRLVVLDVNQPPRIGPGLKRTDKTLKQPDDATLIKEAIAWYQSASEMFRSGMLKDRDEGNGS